VLEGVLCLRTQQVKLLVILSYGLLEGARVADLFCGVGSLGLEALSRGAAFATFVERSPPIADYLEKNIAKAGFVKESRVIASGAFKVGAPIGQGEARYDLVFVDPPYATTREVGPGSSLARLFEVLVGQVVDRGVVVVRTHEDVTLPDEYSTFRAIDRRHWGTMSVTLLQAGPHEQ